MSKRLSVAMMIGLLSTLLPAPAALSADELVTLSVSGFFSKATNPLPQSTWVRQTFTVQAVNVESISSIGQVVSVVGPDPRDEHKLTFKTANLAHLAADVLRCQRNTSLANAIYVESANPASLRNANYQAMALACNSFASASRQQSVITVVAREPKQSITLKFPSEAAARLGLQLIACQSGCANR